MAGVSGTVTGLMLRGSPDLAEIARIVLDAAVPDLADAVSVFAIDRVLRGGEPAHDDDGITVRRLGTRIRHESEQSTQESFPAGEAVVFPGGSPYARCVYSGKPLAFAQQDSGLRVCRGSRKTLPRCSSVLIVPMLADDRPAGFLAFARAPGSAAFGDAELAGAEQLAAGAGAGIASAAALLRQKTIADTLQFSLLAADPEVPPGIEAAARCLPAAGEVVGGDWYDMFPLPGGRSGIIVGDVMGHGPEAAASMAHLRSAARALAQFDPEPADLLARLDRSTAMLRDPVLATCVYAIIDPEGRSCTLAAAGHVPPALVMPDGTAYVPDLPAGRLLGLGPGAYGQTRISLPSGAILALYTDGLVEMRTRSFDQGVLALQAILARHEGSLETACDTLITSLTQRHEDDVTVVLACCP